MVFGLLVAAFAGAAIFGGGGGGGGGGSHHAPPYVLRTETKQVRGPDFACPNVFAAAECASEGASGHALCFVETKTSTKHMSDGSTQVSTEEGAPQLLQCECKDAYHSGRRCDRYTAPHKTGSAARHERVGPFPCPSTVAVDCAPNGWTGEAECFTPVKTTTTQLSDGKSFESREEGAVEPASCKCKQHYSGRWCQHCADGAVRDGGECISASEHRRRTMAADVVRARQALGLCVRGIAELDEPQLERELTVAHLIGRALTLADLLGKPSVVRGMAEELAGDVARLEELVESLEDELSWPITPFGLCCGVSGFAGMLSFLLYLRRKLGALDEIQQQLIDNMENQNEGLIGFLEGQQAQQAQIAAAQQAQVAGIEEGLGGLIEAVPHQHVVQGAAVPPEAVAPADDADADVEALDSRSSSPSRSRSGSRSTVAAKREPNTLGMGHGFEEGHHDQLKAPPPPAAGTGRTDA